MGDKREQAALSDLSLGSRRTLCVADVMSILNLSKNTVYKLAREGVLPSYRVGRQIRFSYDDVMAHLGASAPAEEHMPVNSAPARPAAPASRADTDSPTPSPLPDVLDELPSWMQGSLIIGGQDEACDLLSRYLAGVNVRTVQAGGNGYVSLARMYLGTVQATAIGLWSESEQRYNIPYVKEMLPGMSVIVFRLYKRRVGFTVARNAQVQPRRWSDLLLPHVRIANRERGASSRVLLDEKLAYLEARREDVNGYTNVVTSEFAQALLVARGVANVAITSELPARQIGGLTFLPMQDQVVDLVMTKGPKTEGLVKATRSLLRTEAFRGELDRTVYDVSSMGEVLFES